MPLSAEFVPHGPPAAARLGQLLDELREGDPTAPATVVVPRSFVGLSLRRLLASGRVGTGARRPGLANVRFTTLPALAGSLGAARLAAEGRERLTDPVLRGAIRAALRKDAGVFAPAAEHRSTEDALVEAWGSLREVSASGRERLAARGPRQSDIVRIIEQVERSLACHVDDHHLLDAALRELRTDPATISAMGPVVIHLPDHPSARERELVVQLATCTTVVVLVGATGDAEVDADTAAAVQRLTGQHLSVPVQQIGVGTAALSAPNAEVEVLAAVRDVTARLLAGGRLDRMAITYTSPSPYALLLRDTCARAGIPVIAPVGRTLAQTLPGRALIGAFDVPGNGWRRDEVVAWLDTTGLLHEGRPVEVDAIDRLSRRVGVTHGLGLWVERMQLASSDARHRLEHPDVAGDEVDHARMLRQFSVAERCAAFLLHLDRRLDPVDPPSSWSEWTSWLRSLLGDLLGGPGRRASWPPEEQEAFNSVLTAIDGLAGLDAVDPDPDRARFVSAVRGALDAPAPSTARFGEGLIVGPYRTVAGLDLDVVHVLGMVDGIVPPRPRDDALLPDEDRGCTDGEIPLLSDRRIEHRRTWLAAISAAPECRLSFARGDQRSGRELRPARWFLDTVAELSGAGRQLYARDLADPGVRAAVTTVPSFAAALSSADLGPAIDGHDLDLRTLSCAMQSGDDPSDHWLRTVNPTLARGFDMRRSRKAGTYDRFTGRVRLSGPVVDVESQRWSATSLQSYASCPRRYFYRSVLGMKPPVEPEHLLEPDRMTTGLILHEVMERFIGQQLESPTVERLRAQVAWSSADHERLDTITDEVVSGYERRGMLGHPALWQDRIAELRRDLHQLLEADDEHRRAEGSVPAAVELTFGRDGHPPVELTLRDGRRVQLSGSIDRVDRTADGRAVVVDYKAGSSKAYSKLGQDPVRRGQMLQLAIYGVATRALLGIDDVEPRFWFATQAERFAQVGYALDDQRMRRFTEVMEALLAGIEAGDFPGRTHDAGEARPQDMCTYCDFADACPSDRSREWNMVRASGELSTLLRVVDTDWSPTAMPADGRAPCDADLGTPA